MDCRTYRFSELSEYLAVLGEEVSGGHKHGQIQTIPNRKPNSKVDCGYHWGCHEREIVK